MAGDNLAALAGGKYLSLETYRRTGTPVRTPVWFAEDDRDPSTLYVYTELNAGKVKRIRNNANVKIAPCTMRGTVKGDWIAAAARLVEGDEAARGHTLLNRKYWPKRLVDFLSPGRRAKLQIIAIIPAA
jgi:PPOX class probable F420-dependent enzyme